MVLKQCQARNILSLHAPQSFAASSISRYHAELNPQAHDMLQLTQRHLGVYFGVTLRSLQPPVYLSERL